MGDGGVRVRMRVLLNRRHADGYGIDASGFREMRGTGGGREAFPPSTVYIKFTLRNQCHIYMNELLRGFTA